MKHDQFTLPFLDTTSLGGGLGFYGAFPAAKSPALPQMNLEPEEAEVIEAPGLAKPSVPAQDYRLAGDRRLAQGWKARARDNLAAIRLMTAIEAEGRHARPDEQEQLAKFTGFGATDLADKLFRRAGEGFAPAWEDLGLELEELVSREDLANLKRATQYAHFTPEFMILAIWRALRGIGFDGERVLEPGCGTGLFFALAPEALAGKLALTGVEMDAVTARIAKLLYPNARIRHEDFTRARLPDVFDLAIGNPPFSDRTVRADDPTGMLRLSLHDYFIARAIERLKPGGLAAFVTSRWTLDKVDQTARAHIASKADLIGAVRLPQGAMNGAAGTDVVVDILFLQKRDAGAAAGGPAWDGLAEAVPAEGGETALAINRYFVEHPEMVLGDHARTSSAYGPIYTCRPVLTTAGALADLLTQALDRLPRDLFKPIAPATGKSPAPATLSVGTAAEGATIKEGSYLVHDGALVQIIGGKPQPVAIREGKGTDGIPAKHARIIRGLISVRDAVREVLRAELEDKPWGSAQIRLRSAYANFVRNFGPVNLTTISETVNAEGETRETFRRPNLQPFLDDPDVWLIASIEDYDLESGTAKHGPIFRERVLHPEATPLIETAEDALAVTLHETGGVDLDRIAELLGRSRETAIAELGERIFLDPEAAVTQGTDVWVTADAHLSGKIRTKLAVAVAAASLDERYRRNVAALEKTLPEDLKPSDITARLGAPWIPADVVAAFSEDVLGVQTPVYHTVEIASWSINVHAFAPVATSSTDWGTSRRHAGELLMDALNASLPQIYDVFTEDGVEKRVLNAADTEAAKDKLAKIKAAFETWVWKDVERADRLARIYNDRFNNLVPRHFDGSHLTIPGASSVISFYAHQKRGIWRIVASGTTYVAHAVGAGKTFSLAAAIMEQKRLGLITKAMMVVPGHCLAQASREFLQLYPTARILVADETNFVKDKRQRFLARAATAQWDCIIITHSAFKFIPCPADFERGLITQQMQSYSDLLERIDGADRLSRKRIERMKEGLEEDLERLKSRKDDMLTIAEIGVDQLIVDEMQEFRKLSFATNQTTLKGVDPDGSQPAWDLYVKTRYIDARNPGRALVAASGTPITNSLAELFTLQRFIQPDALQERGIQEFDAWAANFGETTTELELQPSGLYKPVTRFCEFVNVPDLMAIYRMSTDAVLKSDLRQYLRLPAIAGGRRQIVAAPASEAFLSYQRRLAERIKAIEQRQRKPQKGDDILLSVITDGRHAAIDLRFVRWTHENEPQNKLNALIDKVHEIWVRTANDRFTRPDGVPYALPGAAQMIFSDLGTTAAEETRGFSAYRWIRDSLVARGVPASQIAFMQDYKKSSAKQRLFNAVNGGQVRILIGSSETMGTGVNAQRRLKALHHLDVPWLPSQIEQREGRIERQGNEHDEIEIYAYATKRSVDATGWQILERKARFIDAAMAGDRSVRRIEDAGSQANQFALAKAIASGDERLMRKAGIASEIARLERLRMSHFDDQLAIQRKIGYGEKSLAGATQRIAEIAQDLARRTPTRGDAFVMTVGDRKLTERKAAGEALIALARKLKPKKPGATAPVGAIGGFAIEARTTTFDELELKLARAGQSDPIACEKDVTPLGLVSRLEAALSRFEVELAEERRTVAEVSGWLPGFKARLGDPFSHQAELDEKQAEMAELEASLAATPGDAAPPEAAGAAA